MKEYIWLVQLDIPTELEDEFNRIYDAEHVPAISKVPGVSSVQRYVLEEPTEGVQKYTTIYHVDSPDLPHSAEWAAASAEGEWKSKIRPFVVNAKLALFRAIS
ncbi:DUF4286 family protein [Microtetraspora sp. NBRC 16547]|uniref:DUF4286 family protein n=1 Tax=Microtetraspora sp. NBRC 16547 TaxID=3030993 RepID=UPI0024A19278|nr:DUF4286 family protein [Microtetraspora sp. NBRC 16547]GLW99352.1 hypothetical protein Misp02_34390 [Microtetraspora sp. NBRC 16547]